LGPDLRAVCLRANRQALLCASGRHQANRSLNSLPSNPSSPAYARPRSLAGNLLRSRPGQRRDPAALRPASGGDPFMTAGPAGRRVRRYRRQDSYSLYYFILSFFTQKECKNVPSVPSTYNHFNTLCLRSCLRSAFAFCQSCLRFTFNPKPHFPFRSLKRRQDLSIEGTNEGTII
jgi:hypothetical protein